MQAPTEDNETMRQGDRETVIHPFPSRNALDHAVTSLMMLQERHLNLAPSTNVQRLLARQGRGLGPQAPNLKPAA